MLISVLLPLTTGAGFVLSGAGSMQRDFGFVIPENKMTHMNNKAKSRFDLPLFLRTGLGFGFETSAAEENILHDVQYAKPKSL